ncbi:MAG: hypothetical protein ABIR56_10370 [Polaromonas sp.]
MRNWCGYRAQRWIEDVRPATAFAPARLPTQATPNKKIVRVLGVTPRTVKWHLCKIYGKLLGVAERDEPVARMRHLEIREFP